MLKNQNLNNMELDQIKNLWNKEEVAETPEISLEKQKEIHSPLEKIRKNMRMEFWMNNVSLIFLIPLLSVFSEFGLVQFTLLSVMIFIVGYYTYNSYQFYKKSKNQSFKTFHHLLELKYEMKLYTELYKSYYVSCVPMFLAFLFLFLQKINFFTFPDKIMHYAPFIMFFAIVVTVLGFGVWWFNSYYGKYIKQIEKTINELQS